MWVMVVLICLTTGITDGTLQIGLNDGWDVHNPPPLDCDSCGSIFYYGREYKKCTTECSGRTFCEYRNKNSINTGDILSDMIQGLAEIAYCCEKHKICSLVPPDAFVERCNSYNPEIDGGRPSLPITSLCCKFGITCDLEPNEGPGNDGCSPPSGYCLNADTIFLCCAYSGLLCNVEPCKSGGRPPYYARCFEEGCLHVPEYGRCCAIYGKCSSPICEPKWEVPEGTEPPPQCSLIADRDIQFRSDVSRSLQYEIGIFSNHLE